MIAQPTALRYAKRLKCDFLLFVHSFMKIHFRKRQDRTNNFVQITSKSKGELEFIDELLHVGEIWHHSNSIMHCQLIWMLKTNCYASLIHAHHVSLSSFFSFNMKIYDYRLIAWKNVNFCSTHSNKLFPTRHPIPIRTALKITFTWIFNQQHLQR